VDPTVTGVVQDNGKAKGGFSSPCWVMPFPGFFSER